MIWHLENILALNLGIFLNMTSRAERPKWHHIKIGEWKKNDTHRSFELQLHERVDFDIFLKTSEWIY